MAWALTIITSVMAGVTVALGYLLKRSIGIAVVIAAIVMAVNSFKQEAVQLVYDSRAKHEASEIRRLELERERMRIEAEDRERQRKLKSAELAQQERAEQRRLQEKLAEVQIEVIKLVPGK